MKTIIMAGGRGSRISTIYPDIPKPLIPIDGIPVLEREICSLRDQGFKELILTVSHMGDKIMDYFGDGSGVSPATGEPLAGSGQMFCYDSPEYVKDMGTPERFYEVEADFIEGRVQSKNLSNRQKAVFLDRDGVINKYVGFLRDVDEFELLPGVSEAIKKINGSGYLCIVVTNQPVIARGEVTVEELDEIHNKMETLLGLESAYIDGLYYCPHHPHKGYEGEIPELKTDCDCRKPKPGMLLKAAEDFNIALAESWMVGDGENDVMAGRNAGCKTAFIRREETEVDADIIVNSLLEFVEEYL